MIRVAVVTGGNKGIGFEIVKSLCKEFDGKVILTARNAELGHAAVKNLEAQDLRAEFHALDIINKESIIKLKDYLVAKYGGLDVLINNAGIAYKQSSNAPFSEQAEVTNKTNFFGTLDVCRILFPILRPFSRVVNVASSSGHLSKASPDIQKRFTSETQTEDELSALINEFIQAAKDGVHTQKGFAKSAYGTSKCGEIALTKIHARQFLIDPRENLIINACCPGWCRTDMAGQNATHSAEQGAVTPVWLALLPPGTKEPHGEFYRDLKICQW